MFIEGSEEDVRVACIEVLTSAGAADRAELVRDRARSTARRKLDALTDPAWHAAYIAIPEIATLLGKPSTRHGR
jgi:hypothetical protein